MAEPVLISAGFNVLNIAVFREGNPIPNPKPANNNPPQTINVELLAAKWLKAKSAHTLKVKPETMGMRMFIWSANLPPMGTRSQRLRSSLENTNLYQRSRVLKCFANKGPS